MKKYPRYLWKKDFGSFKKISLTKRENVKKKAVKYECVIVKWALKQVSYFHQPAQ